MRRVLIIFAVLALASLGAIWLAQTPGDLAVQWRGYEIRTSFVVGAGLVALLTGALVYLWQFLRQLWRVPAGVLSLIERRREKKGYLALTRGLVAVAAGDAREARLRAGQAARLLGAGPLPQLLSAQAAQLDGDAAAARASFTEMLEAEETRVIGHRGLFIQAQRSGEREGALFHARAALDASPRAGWAAEAVFQLETQNADWDGALATLDRLAQAQALDRAQVRRRRAALLTAKAEDAIRETRGDGSDEAKARRAEALAAALEAADLAPAFAPAVALAARLLGEAGKTRKASRLLERAWASRPHPLLYEAYMAVHRDQSAYDRERQVTRLAGFNADHKESRLALARAAIAARNWEGARAALQPFTSGAAEGEPSQKVCELMAEIEEGQFGGRGRGRDWLSRALYAPADPAWVSGGHVSEVWLPVCPRTGRFDAFEWKVPEPLIVPVAAPRETGPEPVPAPETAGTPDAADPAGSAGTVTPARSGGEPDPGTRREEPAIIVPPIIPDDPGPIGEEDERDESPSQGGVRWGV